MAMLKRTSFSLPKSIIPIQHVTTDSGIGKFANVPSLLKYTERSLNIPFDSWKNKGSNKKDAMVNRMKALSG
jgi:hypothetical protein